MQNEPDMPIEPVEPKEPTDQYQPADPPVDPTTEPVEPTAQVPPLQSPTDPISPTEPSAQFQSVDTPDPAVQIPAQIDSASVGNRFINNKFIILFVLTLVVISLVGSGIWLSLKKDNDNGKLKANNYIATATSCAKVTELFKRTYSNSNIDMMSASSVGSTTRGANIQNSMAMSADTSSGSSKSAESSNDYSTTNVQVQGVDEADVVKNDGEYIYTITGGNIYIVKAYPPKDAKLTAKITLANNNSQDYYGDTGASEIFINKNRLMAIGSKSVTSKDLPNIKQGTSASSSASLSSTTESDLPPDYYDPAVNFTFIKVWDTTDKKSPKLVRSVEFEGDYSASRMIGDNVHIVLNGNPRI
ncbi:MAG: beta-propeller domain-containing protein, partial [Candidatus Saccharibacteria bacterium]